MQAEKVILSPIISEKSIVLAESNKYAFKVEPRSNKIEVKKAVESLFKVTVEDVHIMVVKGKARRFGRKGRMGRMADVKKAIVTLKDGDKIEIMKG
jgi:large subunit ribosomal protein L23